MPGWEGVRKLLLWYRRVMGENDLGVEKIRRAVACVSEVKVNSWWRDRVFSSSTHSHTSASHSASRLARLCVFRSPPGQCVTPEHPLSRRLPVLAVIPPLSGRRQFILRRIPPCPPPASNRGATSQAAQVPPRPPEPPTALPPPPCHPAKMASPAPLALARVRARVFRLNRPYRP
jgi:hypothetical protein